MINSRRAPIFLGNDSDLIATLMTKKNRLPDGIARPADPAAEEVLAFIDTGRGLAVSLNLFVWLFLLYLDWIDHRRMFHGLPFLPQEFF